MPRIEDNFIWHNGGSAPHSIGLFWAFPNSPEPGPELPKKKKPKFF